MNAQIVRKEPNSDEKRISELEKEATALSSSNLEMAIVRLKEANYLKGQVSTTYPIQSYLRLPKYLYKNGQFSQAITELEKLIEQTPHMIRRSTFRQDYYSDELYELLCKPSELAHYCAIYELMAKFYRKEKMIDKAEYYETMASNAEFKIEGLSERANKARKLAWEKHRQHPTTKRLTTNNTQQPIVQAKMTSRQLRKIEKANYDDDISMMIGGIIALILIGGLGIWLVWKIFSFLF